MGGGNLSGVLEREGKSVWWIRERGRGKSQSGGLGGGGGGISLVDYRKREKQNQADRLKKGGVGWGNQYGSLGRGQNRSGGSER